jgi:hypothetical protein
MTVTQSVEEHTACHATAPAEPKDLGDHCEVLCCDSIQAVVPLQAGISFDPINLLVGTLDFPSSGAFIARSAALSLEHSGADPPGAFSFAELVLQRSLLKHAPPHRA